MAHIIVVGNEKGGSGKSTTSHARGDRAVSTRQAGGRDRS
jgi:septum formation inhibitor-activating ATPase MinD